MDGKDDLESGASEADISIESLALKAESYEKIENRDCSEYWDRLAKPFKSFQRLTGYAEDFIEKMGLRPGETVLDMGCGSGTLAIPLSDLGYHVTGVDFSAKMLASVQEVIDEEGIDSIDLVRAAWEDDWDECGIPVCDVVVASRSLWGNSAMAVEKLDSRARRRVCLTVPASPTMFHIFHLERILGREMPEQFAELRTVLGKCMDMGIQPEVSYIRSHRIDVYETREFAKEHLLARIGGLRDGEAQAFEDYCDDFIVEHLDEDGNADGWYCDDDTDSAWAFVSWDKDPLSSASRLEVKYHRGGR